MVVFALAMAVILSQTVLGFDWKIVNLPFAICLPRHPNLEGDASIAWQPDIIFPGYEYPIQPGKNSERLSELENFISVVEQEPKPSAPYSSQVTLTEEQLYNYGFMLEETSSSPDQIEVEDKVIDSQSSTEHESESRGKASSKHIREEESLHSDTALDNSQLAKSDQEASSKLAESGDEPHKQPCACPSCITMNETGPSSTNPDYGADCSPSHTVPPNSPEVIPSLPASDPSYQNTPDADTEKQIPIASPATSEAPPMAWSSRGKSPIDDASPITSGRSKDGDDRRTEDKSIIHQKTHTGSNIPEDDDFNSNASDSFGASSSRNMRAAAAREVPVEAVDERLGRRVKKKSREPVDHSWPETPLIEPHIPCWVNPPVHRLPPGSVHHYDDTVRYIDELPEPPKPSRPYTIHGVPVPQAKRPPRPNSGEPGSSSSRRRSSQGKPPVPTKPGEQPANRPRTRRPPVARARTTVPESMRDLTRTAALLSTDISSLYNLGPNVPAGPIDLPGVRVVGFAKKVPLAPGEQGVELSDGTYTESKFVSLPFGFLIADDRTVNLPQLPSGAFLEIPGSEPDPPPVETRAPSSIRHRSQTTTGGSSRVASSSRGTVSLGEILREAARIYDRAEQPPAENRETSSRRPRSPMGGSSRLPASGRATTEAPDPQSSVALRSIGSSRGFTDWAPVHVPVEEPRPEIIEPPPAKKKQRKFRFMGRLFGG